MYQNIKANKLSSIWIQVMGIICMLLGIMFFVTSILNVRLPIFTSFFPGIENMSQQVHHFIIYFDGEYGAVTIGFGVFLFFLGRFGVPLKDLWVKQGLAFGIILWIVAVAITNITSGVYIIAIGNILFGLLMLIPVFLIKTNK